jgi:uncharacterized protein (DUF1778 family)
MTMSSNTQTSNSQTRTKRFNLRATPRQERLIKAASERRGLNVTDFILESACEKAEEALAAQTSFVLDEKQWKLFMEALDRPARIIPEIKKLFSEPSAAQSR